MKNHVGASPGYAFERMPAYSIAGSPVSYFQGYLAGPWPTW
jgi:hypothetical protein